MDIHTFSYEHNDSSVTWDVRDIWEAVEDLPVIYLKLELFKKAGDRVFKTYRQKDYRRVKEADISYPIIIPESSLHTGEIIIDGYHRLFRHRQLGTKLIPVKAISKMPRPVKCKGEPFEIKGLEFDWVDA